jgi:hypothetical protein
MVFIQGVSSPGMLNLLCKVCFRYVPGFPSREYKGFEKCFTCGALLTPTNIKAVDKTPYYARVLY